MIQIHVLNTRDTNTIEQNKRHLKSIGIDLHILNNRGLSVQEGRIKGFQLGAEDYVSFIDDDDISLLQANHVRDIVSLNKDAIYTNNNFLLNNKFHPGTFSFVKEWSLTNEVNKLTKPHQTIVYKRDYAQKLAKRAKELISNKGWPQNTFDYVSRALVSLDQNWYYYPEVTYQWNNNTHGLHKDSIYLSLNKFFFGGLKQ